WLRLFGPVLFYDLVRNARRTRTFVTRCGYLLLLLLILWSVVGSHVESHHYPNGMQQGTADPKEMAALAEAFFVTFMGVQLGFAATALTVSGLAGVAILASVYARRSRDAILLSYLAVGLYCGLCLLGSFLVQSGSVSSTPLWSGAQGTVVNPPTPVVNPSSPV